MAKSGLLEAGTILLLVGSILSTVGAAVLVLLGAFVAWMTGSWFVLVYVVMGVLLAFGAAFGFLSWKRAKRGDLRGAFAFGLTSSLLPPLQALTLVGAILVRVSPEGTAQAP